MGGPLEEGEAARVCGGFLSGEPKFGLPPGKKRLSFEAEEDDESGLPLTEGC